MSANAPIAQMSAPELRRSALMQLVEMRRLYERLAGLNIASLPQQEIDRLFLDVMVREDNFSQTMERVEELAA